MGTTDPIVETTFKKNSIGKRPLGRLRLRWENRMKTYVIMIQPDIPW